VHSAKERLRYYASRFPVVEVAGSHVGLPSWRNAGLWAERDPAGFVFDVKAFGLLTQNQTPPDALPKDIRAARAPTAKQNLYYAYMPPEVLDPLWERFRSALDPLREAGKLGVVLFQFAPWFVYRPYSLDLISDFVERLPGDRIAVEFRNKSWLDERHRARTLDFEREHGVVHVPVDEPRGFASSVPTVWETTSPELAILRLPQRNRAPASRRRPATLPVRQSARGHSARNRPHRSRRSARSPARSAYPVGPR
jgi:uncharacterized protein YecE (DUF72 family)